MHWPPRLPRLLNATGASTSKALLLSDGDRRKRSDSRSSRSRLAPPQSPNPSFNEPHAYPIAVIPTALCQPFYKLSFAANRLHTDKGLLTRTINPQRESPHAEHQSSIKTVLARRPSRSIRLNFTTLVSYTVASYWHTYAKANTSNSTQLYKVG